ncbi:MAG: hypothetical protein GY946_31990 [bacterium]|nr:hypothetical protein [bacterium]
MIAACPTCAARYRIDKHKLGDKGARLRCSRCESVFRVRAPTSQPAETSVSSANQQPAEAPVSSVEQRPAEAPVSSVEQRPAEAPVSSVDRQPVEVPVSSANQDPPEEKPRAQIVIAMPDAEVAKRTADDLSARGLHSMVVFDGVDAMLEIQRQEPVAVLLAAELPKMFGFQVCEIVKRNASLRGIHVVLAGTVHHPERYRRSPSEFYGADSYVEVPDLPGALAPVLVEAGILSPENPPREEPSPVLERSEPSPPAEALERPEISGPAPTQPKQEEPAAASASPSPQLQEEQAQAERLARIIVSDIVLYNEEKFASAVQAGDVAEAMAADLAEGRGLFEQRIDEKVRGKGDHLLEELLRVARARGMQ